MNFVFYVQNCPSFDLHFYWGGGVVFVFLQAIQPHDALFFSIQGYIAYRTHVLCQFQFKSVAHFFFIDVVHKAKRGTVKDAEQKV